RGRRRLAILVGLIGAAAVLSTSAAGVSARPQISLEQPTAGTTTAGSGAAPVIAAYASVSGDGRYYVSQGLPPEAAGEQPADG
ncbi:hypothetical protein, partial [Rhizobium leguminosarum]|uniref:hypothetical protein n=1 Tax=Rhizobium leguminosarum TaxID=384 RepID=UPI003F9BD6CC